MSTEAHTEASTSQKRRYIIRTTGGPIFAECAGDLKALWVNTMKSLRTKPSPPPSAGDMLVSPDAIMTVGDTHSILASSITSISIESDEEYQHRMNIEAFHAEVRALRDAVARLRASSNTNEKEE